MADIPPGKSEVEARTAAWPARTWSPAELVTAGMMNGVRDQLNELHAVLGGGGSIPDDALSDNVALKNQSNTFTLGQRISNETGGDVAARLALKDFTQPAGQRVWQILNYNAQLNFWSLDDAEGTILGMVSFNRDGTVIAPCFYATGIANSLGDLTVRGATNFQGGVGCSVGNIDATTGDISGGTISSRNNINCGANIHSLGQFYPGRVDVTGTQATWYLASHGSYGLYCNTGLYMVGGITVAAGGLCINAPNGTIGAAAVDAWGYACHPGVSNHTAGNAFQFWWNGNIEAWIDATLMGNVMLSSDARLKRDFTPLKGSLDKIRQFRPGSFYYRRVSDNADPDPQVHLGLLAQDVLPIAPELIRHLNMPTSLTPDETLKIEYNSVLTMLVAAVQELDQKVDRLRGTHE